jgi:hypothetical protein
MAARTRASIAAAPGRQAHDTPDREQQHKDRAGRASFILCPSKRSSNRLTLLLFHRSGNGNIPPGREVDGIRKRRARLDASKAEHDATGSKR